MKNNTFRFSAYLIKENDIFVAICSDVDVVSEGESKSRAKKNLAQAVALYIETAIESNLPVVRPIPNDQNINVLYPDRVLERFPLFIDCRIEAYA